MHAHVGTSGWQYPYWREAFYPAGVAQSRWLEYYATRFSTVEVNNTFYRLPPIETFTSWAARTPDEFVFALKANRYLTHMKRLRDPQEPITRILERAQPLGAKLGPILLQLPPNLKIDLALMDAALSCFPPTVKVAVEPRNVTWFVDEYPEVLSRHNAASCIAVSPDRETPVLRTADWGYARFHEGQHKPFTTYAKRTLSVWADRLSDLFADASVYVFFDNDTNACAPRNAKTLAALLTAPAPERSRSHADPADPGAEPSR
jgi:uncharacterized protein YecE (DUF72 family)